jgi:Domain of unknown function (DUF1905)
VDLELRGEVWVWRGPAPWYFVTVPDEQCGPLEDAAADGASYGWGMVPVTARLGGTTWTTSLYPYEGRYVVPVKAAVRKAEGVDEGDVVTLRLTLGR